jgi:hypothetical protein
MRKLTERQVAILVSLRDRVSEEKKELLNRVLREQLPRGEIEAVCQLINDEFLMKGINPDYSPNEYGRELEQLLDAVNRPRLIAPS